MQLSDLDLTADDRSLRETVRDVVRSKVAPAAAEIDRTGVFPQASVDVLADLGMFGILLPSEYGGGQGTRAQVSIVIEEVARGCGSTALTLMGHVHSAGLVATNGSDDQKQRWLPGAASGRSLAAVAITEPEAGSDASSLRTAARRTDGGYTLNGRKVFITNGDHAEFVVVFARVEDHAEGDGQVSAFIVDGESVGLSASSPFKKMGLRGSSTVELILEDVHVPADQLLGETGHGLDIAYRSLDGARMSTATQALGLAQGAFDIAFEYAQQRVQFGKPIVHHQAVQIRLADMHADLAAARALVYQVARLMDAEGWEGHPAEAAEAKLVATRMAMKVTTDAVELLGGYGFMQEYQVERYMRDAKGGQIYDGTSDINRLLIVRQLLRRQRAAV